MIDWKYFAKFWRKNYYNILEQANILNKLLENTTSKTTNEPNISIEIVYLHYSNELEK